MKRTQWERQKTENREKREKNTIVVRAEKTLWEEGSAHVANKI